MALSNSLFMLWDPLHLKGEILLISFLYIQAPEKVGKS